MKLATKTGDFATFGLTQFEAAQCIAKSGFRYVDYSFFMDYDNRSGVYSENWQTYCKELREKTEKMGLCFVQAHAPMGKPIDEDNAAFLADTIRSIEACALLGIKNLVVHTGYMRGLSKEETFEKNLRFFNALLRVAESLGVNILAENFDKMCTDIYWMDNAADLLEFVRFVNHPNCHAIFDVGHANLQSIPIYDQILTLGNEIYALHIHDNMGDADAHQQLFCGNLDVDGVIRALLEVGFNGYFTFECKSRFNLANGGTIGESTKNLPLLIRIEEEKLLYNIGKATLSAYGCFEE